MTTNGGDATAPPPLTMNDTVTISRLRHELTTFLAITGWMATFFLFGILIGASL